MEGLIVFGVIAGGLALLDVLALRFGVDSREGSNDRRRPIPGLTV